MGQKKMESTNRKQRRYKYKYQMTRGTSYFAQFETGPEDPQTDCANFTVRKSNR